MAKVTLDMDVHLTARLYGMVMDVPDEVLAKGQPAVLRWARVNIDTVDRTRPESQNTYRVVKVEDVTVVDE